MFFENKCFCHCCHSSAAVSRALFGIGVVEHEHQQLELVVVEGGGCVREALVTAEW
jgi:hypothetical protein